MGEEKALCSNKMSIKKCRLSDRIKNHHLAIIISTIQHKTPMDAQTSG